MPPPGTWTDPPRANRVPWYGRVREEAGLGAVVQSSRKMGGEGCNLVQYRCRSNCSNRSKKEYSGTSIYSTQYYLSYNQFGEYIPLHLSFIFANDSFQSCSGWVPVCSVWVAFARRALFRWAVRLQICVV